MESSDLPTPFFVSPAPKKAPDVRTRTSLTLASLRWAMRSATRIASRSKPEQSVGTISVLYIRSSLILDRLRERTHFTLRERFCLTDAVPGRRMKDEHRDSSGLRQRVGNAAMQHARESAATMGSNCDQIRLLAPREFRDFFCHVLADDDVARNCEAAPAQFCSHRKQIGLCGRDVLFPPCQHGILCALVRVVVRLQYV